MKAWAATAALVAFFAVGGWYFWHGDTPTNPTATPTPVTVPNVAVQAATDARVNGAPDATRIMLVGNSLAYELAPAFKALPGANTFDAAVVACAFPPSVTATYRNPATRAEIAERPCHPSGESAELEAFRPKIVLWLVSDPPEPWSSNGKALHACSQPYDSIYESSLEHEITRLRSTGASVVLTTEAYVRFVVPGGGLGAASLPDRTVDCNNRLRRAVATKTHSTIVDLFGYTCPNGECIVRTNGVTLRPDGLHYSGAGGTLAARWIFDQIR
ncbi:MAG TPA: hypothetical protein VH914_03155 [Acidimicrobiia bacterium]|jgi:hypothetical protein|nr:hypothetical protein [Acidimicrobiia bacterium]